ncbi:MAG: universal stress protein [Burkholderiaceae bacterium]
MKILLAVDGSRYTRKMLAYLVTHEDTFAASNNEFALFTAHPPLPAHARAALGNDVADKYHADDAERVLAPVSKFLSRHGIDARSAWKVGHAGKAIANFAQAGKFDLVLMGSHGHGALANLVMGSVTTQVLAHCKVPVLLVR